MTFSKHAHALALAAGACVLFVAGCGGSEGNTTGASSSTTVVVKRDKPQANGAGANAGAEQAKTSPTAAGTANAGVGNLKGRVVFQGTPPVLAALVQKGQKLPDAVCSKEAIPDEKLVVDSSGGVANVVIFLPKAPVGAVIPKASTEAVDFDNKGCHFVPHLLLMRVGQPVKILNDDFPLNHNTHTLPQRSISFNSTIPKEGKVFTYPKPEPEPCEVKCDIHAWMRGYHFPLDHPFVAVSGANGEFEIKNIPVGEHKFRVWHEAATGRYLNRNLLVTIKPGETTNVDIKYDAGSFAG